MKYLLVQYAENGQPFSLMPCNDMVEVVEWLSKPENAFGKWEINEIARQVEYTTRVSIDIREDA